MLQQAIEKALRAVLCHHERDIPLTHDLGALLSVLPKQVKRPPAEESILGLSEFATVRRYEEGHFVVTDEELQQAYKSAAKVLAWAQVTLS